MNNMILKKKDNNIIEVLTLDEEQIKDEKANFQSALHMCWENCANACSSKCQKICDKKKQSIENYSFITQGIQIITADGKIEDFIVLGCENYEKQPETEKTVEELKRLKQVKDALRMAYFETTTVEDAYIKQYQLKQRKAITSIRGHRPTETEIAVMMNRR